MQEYLYLYLYFEGTLSSGLRLLACKNKTQSLTLEFSYNIWSHINI